MSGRVDDLESIDALEEYVDATAVIMIFVSKGYFKSKNCLRRTSLAPAPEAHAACSPWHHRPWSRRPPSLLDREARCTVDKRKPLTLAHDSASSMCGPKASVWNPWHEG